MKVNGTVREKRILLANGYFCAHNKLSVPGKKTELYILLMMVISLQLFEHGKDDFIPIKQSKIFDNQ